MSEWILARLAPADMHITLEAGGKKEGGGLCMSPCWRDPAPVYDRMHPNFCSDLHSLVLNALFLVQRRCAAVRIAAGHASTSLQAQLKACWLQALISRLTTAAVSSSLASCRHTPRLAGCKHNPGLAYRWCRVQLAGCMRSPGGGWQVLPRACKRGAKHTAGLSGCMMPWGSLGPYGSV